MAVQQGQFVLFGLKVTQGGRDGQPRGGLVQLWLAWQAFAFADRGQHDGSFPLLRAKILKTYIHWGSSLSVLNTILYVGEARLPRVGMGFP